MGRTAYRGVESFVEDEEQPMDQRAHLFHSRLLLVYLLRQRRRIHRHLLLDAEPAPTHAASEALRTVLSRQHRQRSADSRLEQARARQSIDSNVVGVFDLGVQGPELALRGLLDLIVAPRTGAETHRYSVYSAKATGKRGGIE